MRTQDAMPTHGSTATLSKLEVDYLLAVEAERSWMSDMLVRLMAVPSVPGSEYLAQEVIEPLLHELQLDVEIHPLKADDLSRSALASPFEHDVSRKFNVVGCWSPVAPTGKSLVLSGHIDVLEPPASSLWAQPPFEPQLEGDIISGWGGLKAGLVAMLGALRAMRRSKLEPCGLLRFQSVVEEEIGGNGTVATELAAPRLDGALVAGCAAETIAIAQVGVIWIEIGVQIPPGHAASGSGESAVLKALRLAEGIRELAKNLTEEAPPYFKGIPDPLGFNLGTIQGGTVPSMSPGQCTVKCRLGIFPGRSPDQIMELVRTCVDDYAGRDSLLRKYPPTVKITGYSSEGYELDPESDFVKTAIHAHRAAGGAEPALVASTTSTDTRTFVHAGTPAICFGPLVENLHSVEERVSVDELVEAAKKVGLFISEWSGIRPSTGTRA